MTLLALSVASALACKPSWGPSIQLAWSSECLEVTTASGNLQGEEPDPSDPDPVFVRWDDTPSGGGFPLEFTNRCDEALELVQDPCEATDCPFDAVIAPQETLRIDLPQLPERNQVTYWVEVLVGEEGSTLEVKNDSGATFLCEDDGLLGCHTSPWPTSPLAWLARR